MIEKLKCFRNVLGLFFVGWLIFSPSPSDKIVLRDFGSTNVGVQNQYSQSEQDYLLNGNSKIILTSNSNDESGSYTEGVVEDDVEKYTQFVLPKLPGLSPEVMPIGGFVNLQAWGNSNPSRDVQTLETPFPVTPVQPTLNPDWFRPEINPQFATRRDRKLQHQRSLSLVAERKVNEERRKQRKPYYGVGVTMGREFYHPYPQLRDKFHHAPAIGVPIPLTLADDFADLVRNNNYRKRLGFFRDKEKLPPEYVEVAAIKLREHVIDPDTQVIKGTFGKQREARRRRQMKHDTTLRPVPHRKGFILYNKKTKLMSFYDSKTRRLVTYFITNRSQQDDILWNHNIT